MPSMARGAMPQSVLASASAVGASVSAATRCVRKPTAFISAASMRSAVRNRRLATSTPRRLT